MSDSVDQGPGPSTSSRAKGKAEAPQKNKRKSKAKPSRKLKGKRQRLLEKPGPSGLDAGDEDEAMKLQVSVVETNGARERNQISNIHNTGSESDNSMMEEEMENKKMRWRKVTPEELANLFDEEFNELMGERHIVPASSDVEKPYLDENGELELD